MVITTTPLRERMRQALRIHNVSPRTEYIYIHMVAGFAAHFRRSPDRLGRPQIEQYLLFIRDVKKVSYCWYNQCFAPLSPIALDLLRAWWRATHPKELLFPNKNDASRPLRGCAEIPPPVILKSAQRPSGVPRRGRSATKDLKMR